MFSLLAESRFRSWQEKFKEIEAAADRLYTFGSGHLSFAVCANRALDGATAEACSIKKKIFLAPMPVKMLLTLCMVGRPTIRSLTICVNSRKKTNVPAVIDVTHLNSLAPR